MLIQDYRLEQQEPLVTEDTIISSVLTVGEAAKNIWRKKGGGNKAVINQVACGALVDSMHEYFHVVTCISAISEGAREGHAWLPAGTILTRPMSSDRRACVISDAVECEGQFALSGHRSRASTVLFGLAPEGSLPKVDPYLRMRYLCLPENSPVGSGGIEIDSEPSKIVELLCQQFKCKPQYVIVTVLQRQRTNEIADQFDATGATVERIMAGDFQSFVEAAAPVKPGGPIRISAGEGGLTEAFCAVPYLKWSGGILLTQIVRPGMEEHVKEGDGFVFTKETMIRSDDCLLAVGGLTEADAPSERIRGQRYIVPGVRTSQAADATWVTVLIASPKLRHCRRYVVEFEGTNKPQQTLLRQNESLNEHLLFRYLAKGNTIETLVGETSQGDRHFFQHWSGSFVPGLEFLSERELVQLLLLLEKRGRITTHAKADPWDTCQFHLTWTVLN